MVAHHIDIVEVVGSSPISPTIKPRMTLVILGFILRNFTKKRRTQEIININKTDFDKTLFWCIIKE